MGPFVIPFKVFSLTVSTVLTPVITEELSLFSLLFGVVVVFPWSTAPAVRMRLVSFTLNGEFGLSRVSSMALPGVAC